jgi:Cu(I)/Ag(I) efflux system membrane fusion protein
MKKLKTLFLPGVIAALAAAVGWFAARHWPATSHDAITTSAEAGRRIKFYQSAMHPWVTSPQPGKCTVCGMDLVPVYEGEAGFDGGAGRITLSSNSVSVIHVQTAEAKRQPLRRTLRFAGTIDDDDTRHRFLSAYVEGRVDRLFVNFIGAEVTAGEPLATLYSPMLLAAEREFAALTRSTPPENSPVRADHQRLVAAAAQRLRQLGLSDAQIAALPGKREDDIHTALLAPMTGTVVARMVYEGQYVKEGDKLFELADFSTMWFKFDAYERDLAWIQPGQAVEVRTPAVPGKTYAATIAFIDPNLNEATRSAKVRVELANPLIEDRGRRRRELFHKLYAEGVVRADSPEVLAVPRSAVLAPGAGAVVYVDVGNATYRQVRVKLGRAGDDLWEILDGLKEGDRVVTAGNLLIDAQAQLNQGAAIGGHDHGAAAVPTVPATAPATGSRPALNAAQSEAARQFLAAMDAAGAALARDQVAEFNRAAAQFHTTLPALGATFANTPAWRPIVQRIEASGHLLPAADLNAARKAFLPLSMAAVEFARTLRAGEPEFQSLKIYQCPMVDRAFEGAPKSGQWLQLQPPLRNPFFGAGMLDCGTEVK